MDSSTIDLVFNASVEIFSNKSLNFFCNFSAGFFSVEPGFYHYITDIVETMKAVIQKRQNHLETSLAVKVSWGKQKMRFTSEMKDRVLNSFVRTWVLFLEAMLALTLLIFEKKTTSQASICFWHFPHTFSHGIHRLDWVHNCWQQKSSIAELLFSKQEHSEIKITGHYMNYQKFCNLQLRPLLKNSVHSFVIDLRNASGERYHSYLCVIFDLFWFLEKLLKVIFNQKLVPRWLL